MSWQNRRQVSSRCYAPTQLGALNYDSVPESLIGLRLLYDARQLL